MRTRAAAVRRFVSRRWTSEFLFVAVFGVAAALSAWIIAGPLEQQISLPALLPWLLLLPVLAFTFSFARVDEASVSRAWTILWVSVAALAFLNQVLEWVPVAKYGDWREFEQYVTRQRLFIRWFAGSALLNKLHYALVTWGGLPGDRETAGLFLRGASVVIIGFSSVLLLRRWPTQLRVVLPCLVPIWVLFAAGHAEYYPFIAGLWVFALAWVMERPLSERSPKAVGVLAAALFPLSYLGFAPQAALLLLAYGLAAPRRVAAALLWASGTVVLGVLLFWPGGFFEFFTSLLASAGDPASSASLFSAYRGHLAGADSIFFSWDYALSPGHLLDLMLMQSVAGGPLLPLLALIGGGLWLRQWRSLGARRLRDPRAIFLLAICLWQAHYFLRMLPVLGPIRDIDIFFSSYLTLAFLTGFLFDRLVLAQPVWRHWALLLVVAACLGSTAAAAPNLLFTGVGLPRARWGAEEYALALQRGGDPALARELARGIEEGRVLVRRIKGNASALAAGLAFDRWTRGSNPAAVLVENSSEVELALSLTLVCFPPDEYLPVRITVKKDQDPSRQFEFLSGSAQTVNLGLVEPGDTSVVAFWSDKGWPGDEQPPRHLGVKLESVNLVEVANSVGRHE